jgi:hypothetical protein
MGSLLLMGLRNNKSTLIFWGVPRFSGHDCNSTESELGNHGGSLGIQDAFSKSRLEDGIEDDWARKREGCCQFAE